MMPRFLLAKYAPNLHRMEPRNIGVLLWARGAIECRFLNPSAASFVQDQEQYEWWIRRWKEIADGAEITPVRGEVVSKKTPLCLDALLTHQEDNFLLVDSGELLDEIPKRELGDAAAFLFSELVSRRKQKPSGNSTSEPSLKARCRQVFAASGLASRNDFHDSFAVECSVLGSSRHLNFSYAIGDDTPSALYQRVSLGKEQSVNSATLIMHAVQKEAILSIERCAALIQSSAIRTRAAEEGVKQLARVCKVIDTESSDASQQVLAVAGIDGELSMRM